jgi:hypothetical protein
MDITQLTDEQKRLLEMLRTWPIYVNDHGVTNCDKGGCEEPYFLSEYYEGRRGTIQDWTNALMKHIVEQHEVNARFPALRV